MYNRWFLIYLLSTFRNDVILWFVTDKKITFNVRIHIIQLMFVVMYIDDFVVVNT